MLEWLTQLFVKTDHGPNMDAILKRELNTSALSSYGSGGGGCINTGQGYTIDGGEKIFVKFNSKSGARLMFDGEAGSLEAINATASITAPKPIKVVDNPDGGAALVTDYIEMKGLGKHSAKLGEQLARMHLHNSEVCAQQEKRQSSIHKSGDGEAAEGVRQFGFHVRTCCGYIPQANTWADDWVTFYTNKLGEQLDMAEKEYGDREARDLWPQLQRVIPQMFVDLDIKPALVHGDLWSGNVAGNSQGPVIFDPASFYGHSEYEFGIIEMFGGFGGEFRRSYHKVIPQSAGFKQRVQLYTLFHCLNHWNHFGGGYRGQSMSIMRRLVK